MELRKIDKDRELLVGFYLSDAVRGSQNPGISSAEYDALVLVNAYEVKEGRSLVGDGPLRAASRMLDNAFRADDGVHELATFMAADMAFQRHAARVVEAGEAFAKDGSMPEAGTFERVYTEYVIPDIANDPDAASDWKAMSQGRFDAVSSMSTEIFEAAVKDREHLPAADSSWFYKNAPAEEMWEPTRGAGLVDVLDLAEGALAHEHRRSGMEGDGGVAEWLAAEPAAHEWDDAEHEARVGGYLGKHRHAVMMEQGRDPVLLLEEIRDMGAERTPEISKGADVLQRMLTAGDAAKDAMARSLADAVQMRMGASAGVSQYWSMMDGPSDSLTTALVRDAASIARRGAGMDHFEEVRMEMATGPRADDYSPFRPATFAELDRADYEVRTVQQKQAHSDETIYVDPSLERAMAYLDAQGMRVFTVDGGNAGTPVGSKLDEETFGALERAFARAEDREARTGPMSPSEKARLIVYDVATQEEARGLSMLKSGRMLDVGRGAAVARNAQRIVEGMGVRSLTQAELPDADLAEAGAGRFERVSEFHRAGIDLGMSWVAQGTSATPAIDRAMQELMQPSSDRDRDVAGLVPSNGSAKAPSSGPDKPQVDTLGSFSRSGQER